MRACKQAGIVHWRSAITHSRQRCTPSAASHVQRTVLTRPCASSPSLPNPPWYSHSPQTCTSCLPSALSPHLSQQLQFQRQQHSSESGAEQSVPPTQGLMPASNTSGSSCALGTGSNGRATRTPPVAANNDPAAHSANVDSSGLGTSIVGASSSASNSHSFLPSLRDDADSVEGACDSAPTLTLPAASTAAATANAMMALSQASQSGSQPQPTAAPAPSQDGASSAESDDALPGQLWHQPEGDIAARLQVAKVVIKLLQASGIHQTLLGDCFLRLVRRLELLLYRTAASYDEFVDGATMQQRMLLLLHTHRLRQPRPSDGN
ncbi:MAG: hypothetical protein WDW38_003387 [Sanguina aurantia]